MKSIFSLLIFIIFGALICLLIWIIQMGQAFSWKPPSTEFSLTQKEIIWKKQIESNYNCEIVFIGLNGDNDYDPYIYLTINFSDNSNLKKDLNTEIESITKKISRTFITSSENKRKQSHIFITYAYKNKNNLVLNNIPNNRNCLYHINSKTIIATNKKLIIPKVKYHDFYNNELFSFKLGCSEYYYLKHSDNDSLLKYYHIQNPINFKKLENCQSYTNKFPLKIMFKDGYIESIHRYTFYENNCVSVIINYKCFPKNKNLSATDFVKKVSEISPSRLKNSKNDNLDLLSKIKGDKSNYHRKSYNVVLKFKVDSLKTPWTIEYETSLDEFNYYRTFEEN